MGMLLICIPTHIISNIINNNRNKNNQRDNKGWDPDAVDTSLSDLPLN